MSSFIDQLNRSVSLSETPLRIVSLVPSQTELLFSLGLDEEVVGITKFCVHPNNWYRSKPRIGGTKTVHIEKVRALSPTLIIANKEENTKADIEALEKIAPVWISDVCNIADSLDMIQRIGALVNRSPKAAEIITKLRTGFEQINHIIKGKTVLYLIWKNPIMVAASGTYINAMLEHLGFVNLASEQTRYPELTLDDLKKLKPDFLVLSSEPYPFKVRDISLYKVALPTTAIKLVDGELYSWYGSRLLGRFEELMLF
jgi:ABC-type Fe3+-hydroxamate transport system substrate-binding protein